MVTSRALGSFQQPLSGGIICRGLQNQTPQLMRSTAVSTRRLVVVASTEKSTCVTVCQAKDCRRKGSKRVLEYFKQLAPGSVDVEEEMCFDECGMGPNVQLGGSGRIVNGISSMQDVADLFAAECVDGEEALQKLATIKAEEGA